jgi:hypothetical protein
MWPSPNVEAKSQLLSLKIIIKVPTSDDISFEVGSWLVYAEKYISGLVLRVGINFLLDLTLNTKSHALSCKHPCHTWDLRLGILCEVVSPNFHALNNWDCMDGPQVTGDLDLGPCVNRPLNWYLGDSGLLMSLEISTQFLQMWTLVLEVFLIVLAM